MSQTQDPNSVFNTVVVPAIAVTILIVLAIVLIARGGNKPTPAPANISSDATATPVARGECAEYDKSAEDVSAEVDVELEMLSFYGGLNIQTGGTQYRREMDDSLAMMKTLVETARRCAGYSDSDLGLTPEILKIIGVAPKPKREKP
jgi:hypothetical protein